MANEAKQFTINGVTHDVMDVGARQLIADLQTAINAITSGDTTTAIKTFQEVINFLDGVTDDQTLVGKLNELRTLINGKQATLVSGTNIKTVNNESILGEGNISIPKGEDGDDGKSAYEIAVDNGFEGTEEEWLASLKGAKGDTGNVQVDGDGNVLIVNDLTTGGSGAALSARQGKILKSAVDQVQANLQAVLDALANMAFTGNKPTLTPIDWTGGTFYATIVKSLTGCTATDNTTNGQIAEGSTLTMQLTASSCYTLTGATISVTDSRGQSVAYTLNGSTLSVANVMGTINISVVAVAVYSVANNDTHVDMTTQTPNPVAGSSWSGTLSLKSGVTGYALAATPQVTMGGVAVDFTATGNSWNRSTGAMTIGNVTGNIVILEATEEVGKVTISKSLRNVVLADNADGNNKIAEGSDYAATIAAITKNVVDLYRKYTDASPHANFTNYGTPMKVVQSPAGVVASGASITYNQDGTASVVKNDIDADLTIIAVAESRIKAGYGYNSGSSHTPAEYAGKGCTESIIPIPQGINYLEWKHNAATNGYTSTGGGRGGINLNVLVITADGAFTYHASVGVTVSSGDTTYLVINQSNANLTKFIFASFPIGSTAEQQRTLLDECYIKGYTVSDPSNPDITGLTPVVLFDGSKSEII